MNQLRDNLIYISCICRVQREYEAYD